MRYLVRLAEGRYVTRETRERIYTGEGQSSARRYRTRRAARVAAALCGGTVVRLTTSVDKIIAAAAAHGRESEPDHEVGDLQDALRAAWRALSTDARRSVLSGLELWEGCGT